MVQGQQQHMVLVRHHHQSPAQQRAALQVKRRRGLAVDQRIQRLLGLRVTAQVLHLQGQHVFGRHDQHMSVIALLGKTTAQGFVARNDTRQRPLQGLDMQLPAQT